MSLFADAILPAPATDDSSNIASSSSTPPTTVADSASLHSDASKHDAVNLSDDEAAPGLVIPIDIPITTDVIQVVEAEIEGEAEVASTPPTSPPRRARRARAASPVYNLARLSGTSSHGKRRSKGDIVATSNRRRTTGDIGLGDAEHGTHLSGSLDHDDKSEILRDTINALDLQLAPTSPSTPRSQRRARESPRSLRSTSRLNTGSQATATSVFTLGSKLSKIGKNSRKAVNKGVTRMTRELMRLQDTKEFAHVDDRPVVHTVWSNGKFIDPNATPEPPKPTKKQKVEQEEPEKKEAEKEETEPITNIKIRHTKKYLSNGLYSGQETPKDPYKGLTAAEKKKLTQLPEFASTRVNKVMPMPMFTGLRLLLGGRDFRLPYHVCNPLPPGQPKPDEWKKMTKNRFIGDSKDYWRKMPHMHDNSSKCVCKPEDGCGESCQNRIMLYECDEANCNIGKQGCTNRAFADLTTRRAKGGKYRVGVEVIKTGDRGYGVRSNRCFKPNQIIMEYAGEIITEEECERRMNEVYKDNECYYLMSFDQNMIIDATTGSIARFVNHSCNPNCRMIKWIVSGQPRMALFAGDRPIMTGDELTYDYNFDPFSAKNVQKCLCGQPNCRGVLGPKPREVKPPKTDLKNAVKATVKAGKRKLKELIGDDADGASTKAAKKRKIQPAKGVKRSISTASLKAAKGAATVIKKGASAITLKGKKKPAAAAKAPAKRRAGTGALLKKTTTKRVIKTYGKGGASKAKQVTLSSSSLTVVALAEGGTASANKISPKKTTLKKTKAMTVKKAATSTTKTSTQKKAARKSVP